MKIIHSGSLQSLPREVKELIRDGVYALYTTDHAGAAFVLVTNRDEIYLLSSSGSIAPAPSGYDVRSVGVREAVAFSDAPQQESARVNWA